MFLGPGKLGSGKKSNNWIQTISKHRFWGPYGRICSLFPQFCCRGVSEVQVADTLNEAVGHGVCTCSRLTLGMTLGKPWKPNQKAPV